MFSTATPIIVPVFDFAAQVEALQNRWWTVGTVTSYLVIGKALNDKFRSFAEDRKAL